MVYQAEESREIELQKQLLKKNSRISDPDQQGVRYAKALELAKRGGPKPGEPGFMQDSLEEEIFSDSESFVDPDSEADRKPFDLFDMEEEAAMSEEAHTPGSKRTKANLAKKSGGLFEEEPNEANVESADPFEDAERF